jgi:hypothetical protein
MFQASGVLFVKVVPRAYITSRMETREECSKGLHKEGVE